MHPISFWVLLLSLSWVLTLETRNHIKSNWGFTSLHHKMDALLYVLALEVNVGNRADSLRRYCESVLTNLSDQGCLTICILITVLLESCGLMMFTFLRFQTSIQFTLTYDELWWTVTNCDERMNFTRLPPVLDSHCYPFTHCLDFRPVLSVLS